VILRCFFLALASVVARSLGFLHLGHGVAQPSRNAYLDAEPRLYAIVDGRLDVTICGARVGTKVRADGVGEIDLLHEVQRTATVTAASPATVLVVDRESC